MPDTPPVDADTPNEAGVWIDEGSDGVNDDQVTANIDEGPGGEGVVATVTADVSDTADNVESVPPQ